MIHVILLLLISSFTQAADTSIARTPNGRLVLSASCENAIQKELQTIIDWTKKLENRTCATPSTKKSSEGMCVADITDCVPAHVKMYHGFSTGDNGPNCWNLALNMGGLLPMLRESSLDEWDFYLSSPLCRELGTNEVPRMGDLGSIEARTEIDKGHIHGFMYISPTLAYSKNGTNISAPYALQPLEKVTKTYDLGSFASGECSDFCDPKDLGQFMTEKEQATFKKGIPGTEICYLNLTLNPILKRACDALKKFIADKAEDCKACAPSSMHYYRCQSFDEYFDLQNFAQKNELKIVDDILSESESCAQGVIFLEKDPGILKDLIVNNMIILNAYLAQQKWESQTEDEKFMLKRFRHRLESLEQAFIREIGNAELLKLFRESRQQLQVR